MHHEKGKLQKFSEWYVHNFYAPMNTRRGIATGVVAGVVVFIFLLLLQWL